MTPPDPSVARGHLRNLAMDTMYRLDEFLGSHDEDVPPMIDNITRNLIERIDGARYLGDPTDETLGEDAALRALRLIPRPEPEFWLTDLGRLIARRVGFGGPAAPRPHAAAILGVTKQRVYQLERDGALKVLKLADGTSGIDNESLVTRLRSSTQRG